MYFGTWLTEIQKTDWSVTVIYKSIDHAIEINVFKTTDNSLNCGLMSFRQL